MVEGTPGGGIIEQAIARRLQEQATLLSVEEARAKLPGFRASVFALISKQVPLPAIEGLGIYIDHTDSGRYTNGFDDLFHSVRSSETKLTAHIPSAAGDVDINITSTAYPSEGRDMTPVGLVINIKDTGQILKVEHDKATLTSKQPGLYRILFEGRMVLCYLEAQRDPTVDDLTPFETLISDLSKDPNIRFTPAPHRLLREHSTGVYG